MARVSARDEEDALLAAPGSLGLLGETIIRVGALSTTSGEGTLLIAAADHPVAALGVSAFPVDTTRLVATALAAGEGQGAAAAMSAGMALRLVDCGMNGEPIDGWAPNHASGTRGDIATGDAMTDDDVDGLLRAGVDLGHELAATGPVEIGELGIGNTTVGAVVAASVLGVPPAAVVGRGAGSDTATMQRKHEVVERALERLGRRGPRELLDDDALRRLIAAIGGPEQALLTGVCLGVADADGLVVLDGMLTGTAALLAVRNQPTVQRHLVAGQVSAEPAHRAVLDALGLEPLLDLRLRAGEGIGAVLATSLIKQTEQVQKLTARTR
ncbi:MAG TPA: nicotinate-nucleotide--dimethylbenzimidazole phosphoribosyltransferase [Mycobacteriales bacterium]|nr:nicotinate-nucleotide--dimethylbenzimidazole phosphoribosyltransferase [Mycobacteriales bacterium]